MVIADAHNFPLPMRYAYNDMRFRGFEGPSHKYRGSEGSAQIKHLEQFPTNESEI